MAQINNWPYGSVDHSWTKIIFQNDTSIKFIIEVKYSRYFNKSIYVNKGNRIIKITVYEKLVVKLFKRVRNCKIDKLNQTKPHWSC